MKNHIGDAALAVMREYDVARLGWGDAFLLHEIYNRSRCQGRLRVPTDAWQHVLNALERDERFVKSYFRGHSGAKGETTQKRRLRSFTIRGNVP